MAGKTIDEVTPDTSVGGAEKIPVSDAGTAKSVTTAKIKDYVIGAIAALFSGSATAVNSDSVYLKQNGSLVPLPLNTLCDAIYAYMFDKTAVSTFTTSDIIAVENSGSTKTTTLGNLCAYVATQINPTFNIHSMDDGGTFSDDDEIAMAQAVTTFATVKRTILGVANFILGKLTSIATSISPIGSDDYMLVLTGSPLALKRVKRSDAGIGLGDVSGPSATTENKVPQWDATTKKLKDGKAIATSVTSSSTSDEIPTADVVYSAIVSGTNTKVDKPNNNTDGNVPRWNGADTGALDNGLSVQTSVRASASASDSAIATEKAVRTAIDAVSFGDVTGPASSTDGDFARFNGATGKLIKSGIAMTTSIRAYSGSTAEEIADHTHVPTEKAVREAIHGIVTEEIVLQPEDGTIGNTIPMWSSTQGRFANDAFEVEYDNVVTDEKKLPSVEKVRRIVFSEAMQFNRSVVPTATATSPLIVETQNGLYFRSYVQGQYSYKQLAVVSE